MPEDAPFDFAQGKPYLAASYARCREITQVTARNFYYGLQLLPPAKRDALCALYAFMRNADDISDSPGDVGEKQRRLAAWRAALDRALLGEHDRSPLLPAFHDTVVRYNIPSRYLRDLISGVEMDLSFTRYPTFDRLREYCYRVAGTVGVCCAHVFGFRDPRAVDLAERLGIAFQLTNILRDIAQDQQMGRVYLPQEDLRRFGCQKALATGTVTEPVARLLEFEAGRAREFYAQGVELIWLIEGDSRPALWALVRIYSGLLAKIEACGYDVFSSRVALSKAEKTWIMLRARLGWWSAEDVVERRDRDRRRAGGTFLRRRAG